MNHLDILFPYEEIREEQNKLLRDVKETIDSGKNLIAHAPTGLGKTIAAIGPAIKYAIENNKTVFFLTNRHTQHLLAIRTLKDIQQKYNIPIKCCDIIAKKWMCAQKNADSIASSEFPEYCKALREDNLCDYYINTKQDGKLGIKAKYVLTKIAQPADTESINSMSKKEKVCPYEIASVLAKDAHVIIADYNYIFNENVRESFLSRAQIKLSDCILVIDEGHNLPNRCRDMMSETLSNFILKRAILEAEKFDFDKKKLKFILDVINELGEELTFEKNEEYILRNEFFKKIDALIDYQKTIQSFEEIGKKIREEQRFSYIGAIAKFMTNWLGPDHGYCRTISLKEAKKGKLLLLRYRCLDPALISKEIIKESFSTIIMSGTLTPKEMYADLLGFTNYKTKEYKDPFSDKNRLNLIVDEVTTKFTERSNEQYKKIASIVSDVINSVPGNSLVFFPSYELRNTVEKYIASKKKIFLEVSGMNKEEKKLFLEEFKSYKDKGAVILGVAQGSFGEGIDLPGDLLKCVAIVGVPLSKPDLETKDLVEYYEDKFGQGMNYGYIYPAITKTLQNAGRCIRSESDRGVIVFMDARYTWENYSKCFPKEWNMKITKMWKDRIEKFFTPEYKFLNTNN